MDEKVSLECVYVPSGDVVVREIEGEIIIVPLVSGIGDLEDELFTLNDTAKAIWEKLDGKRKLQDVLGELSYEYEGPEEQIKADLLGLMGELLKRRIVVEASGE